LRHDLVGHHLRIGLHLLHAGDAVVLPCGLRAGLDGIDLGLGVGARRGAASGHAGNPITTKVATVPAGAVSNGPEVRSSVPFDRMTVAVKPVLVMADAAPTI